MDIIFIISTIVFLLSLGLLLLGLVHPAAGFSKSRKHAAKRYGLAASLSLISMAVLAPEVPKVEGLVPTSEAELPAQQTPPAVERKTEHTEEPAATVPDVQRELAGIVGRYAMEYARAQNELQKSALRRKRKAEMEPIAARSADTHWVGTIKSMGTTSDGEATLYVKLSDSNTLLHTENFRVDGDKGTIIPIDSPIYDALLNAEEGDLVEVVVKFFQDTDGLDAMLETSLTEGGSMREPEFLVEFATLRRIGPGGSSPK